MPVTEEEKTERAPQPEARAAKEWYCIGSIGPDAGLYRLLPVFLIAGILPVARLVPPMEFISQNIFLITLAVVSGLGLLLPLINDARNHATLVTPAQAVMLMNRQNAILVDVRDATEFSQERIEGARNIPAAELAGRTGELEKFKSRPVILACASGSRSGRAIGTLKKAGFEQVFNLDGGLKAWKDAGQPVRNGARA